MILALSASVVECEELSRGGEGPDKNAGPAFYELKHFALVVSTRYGYI
jgi:hypothetical protein